MKESMWSIQNGQGRGDIMMACQELHTLRGRPQTRLPNGYLPLTWHGHVHDKFKAKYRWVE